MTHRLATVTPARPSTRDAILDAAERRFAERGFDGVSVREIAADVGLKNQASLYYHFASKQEIYEAVLRRGVDAIIARLAGSADVGTPSARCGDGRARPRPCARLPDRSSGHRAADPARGLDESDVSCAAPLARDRRSRCTRWACGCWQMPVPWRGDELPHVAAGLYHLIFGYFADAALLEACSAKICAARPRWRGSGNF